MRVNLIIYELKLLSVYLFIKNQVLKIKPFYKTLRLFHDLISLKKFQQASRNLYSYLDPVLVLYMHLFLLRINLLFKINNRLYLCNKLTFQIYLLHQNKIKLHFYNLFLHKIHFLYF